MLGAWILIVVGWAMFVLGVINLTLESLPAMTVCYMVAAVCWASAAVIVRNNR